MKDESIRAGISSILSAVVLISGTCMSTVAHAEGPPFRQGEVVVAGAPDRLPPGHTVLKYLPHADLTVIQVEKGKEFGQIQRLRSKGRKAGLNYIAHASEVPNDSYYTYQWNFQNIQAETAWDISTGAGVTVAVLDTGLADSGSSDGIGCVVSPYDAVDNDFDPVDVDGHGTHVSGTIAQATNNGIGVAGLAYSACIMPVKVLGDDGSGSFADIAEGIHYAVDYGAEVINMSLGTNARYGLRNDPVMDAELDYAASHGVTVVCASGNDSNRKNVSYPAIYPTTIAVGATDLSNKVTRYSNKGEGLDLVAPGGDMKKDANNDGYGDGVLQETRVSGSWGYYFFTGTSMASPHVAAVAAMLIADTPGKSPQEVYNDLTSTALDLNEAGYDSSSGFGLVQAYNALMNIQSGGDEPGGGGTDADADGWTVEDGDCDDTDADVYPGHPDAKGRWGRDGVDNDCNGVIDG